MKAALAVLFLMLLVACGRTEYRQADDLVLCDPKTNHAYLINKGMGDTSFTIRNAVLDDLCKK